MISLISFVLAVSLGIIPQPGRVEMSEGTFELPEELTYSFQTGKGIETTDLEQYLESRSAICPKSIGLNFRKVAPSKAAVRFSIGKSRSGAEESYRLRVSQSGIAITAPTCLGATRAVQTLMQMAAGESRIQCCTIDDAPAYRHRGILFDVSRHFRSVEFLKKQIDVLALAKLNVFHFHLVDGAGWRLLLDSHPELVKKSAFRIDLAFRSPYRYMDEPEGYVPGTVWDKPGCYGGYYTKDQVKEIIDYARIRGVEVIPEIEMPGHNPELLGIHPELFCDEIISKSSVCPSKDTTFNFFAGILDEIIELFPSQFIHIGGDEAPKSNWTVCADCQRKIKEEGLRGEEGLQSWFIGKIDRYVKSRGRRIIGWDEIMQGGLSEGATVMSWNGTEQGLAAMEMGHDVIMTPTKYCYLDYYQSAPQYEPMAICGYVPLSKTYSFEMPEGEHILGLQGNLWSEYIISDENYEYMLYPRAFAIAELGWTTEKKDYEEFAARAEKLCGFLHSKGYTTFNLREERPVDPGMGIKEIVNLAKNARCTIRLSDKGRKAPDLKSTLTNGRNTGVVHFYGKAEIEIALEKVQDIHVICPYFQRHNIDRDSALPSLVKFLVSSDGINYQEIGQARPMVDDADLTWATVPVPVFCNEKAVSHIRLIVEPSETCPKMSYVRGEAEALKSTGRSGRFQHTGLVEGTLCNGIRLTEIVVN